MQQTKYLNEWLRAVETLDRNKIEELSKREAPEIVLLTIASMINGSYNGMKVSNIITDMMDQLNVDKDEYKRSIYRKIELTSEFIPGLRYKMAHKQRDFDIKFLQFVRKSGYLSIAIGAGVSVPSGCPNWPKLVKAMLNRAISKGREIRKLERSGTPPFTTTENGDVIFKEMDGKFSITNKLIKTIHLDSKLKNNARRIIHNIDTKNITVHTLNQGAQIAYDFYGQELFTHFTSYLYKNKYANKTHRAIAELSMAEIQRPQGVYPGLKSIISYNFENLMGEALAEREIPYRAIMPLKESFGCITRPTETNSKYQEIYYIHGFNPRELFRITDIAYIFATSQYTEYYKKDDPENLLDYVLDNILANPLHFTLYIGCSFIDTYMNQLLEDAHKKYPGRWHYAILLWEGKDSYLNSNIEQINKASEKYLKIGVQPIWIDDFDEIPETLLKLK